MSQLAIPGTDAAEQPEGTLIWPPEPPDEAEPYTTPIDRAAYARQALTDAVPDWLGALKTLDSRGGCPWVQIWSHNNTNTAA